MMTLPRQAVATMSAALLAFGCAASNAHVENRMDLEGAFESMHGGDVDGAIETLESLVIRTNEEPDGFELQRYFAAYLLSRANLQKSVLERGDEWIARSVAASYYWSFAQDWAKDAQRSGQTSESGDALLPEALADYGFDNTQTYLNVVWLVACARTNFQDEVADVIARDARFGTVEGATELADAIAMTDGMRPWLFWSLYDFHKDRNEPLAYKFGIRARELGRAVPAAFPKGMGDGIVSWILEESNYVFKSSAGIEFDPGADECSQTGEPNIKFQGVRKS